MPRLARPSWTAWLVAALAPAVAGVAAGAAAASDGMLLTLTKGAGAYEATLAWTGSQPLFEVHRSDDPQTVLEAGNLLSQQATRTYSDSAAPGSVLYFAIARTPDPPATIVDGAEDRILLTGTVVGPAGPFAGEVLVEGSLITCAASSCAGMPGAAGATVVTTNGIIMPGLIDAHNHGLFDVFDEGDWNPQVLYGDHDDWTSDDRYQEMVDAKQYLAGEMGSPVDYRCEMDKYAEVKALVAGTTSFLLAPGTSRACFASAVRTIDTPQNDLGIDKIQTSIAVPNESGAQAVCDNFTAGTTDAYVVHVAEGINQTALNEFTTLSSRAGGCLLSPKTTIVHGTALGVPEFATMASYGMKLVWSPRSNMDLYAQTTRIDLAIQQGVATIALAPDWSLNGSANMLDELRYADGVDAALWGDILTPQRLFEMATIDAARTLALDGVLGSIAVGKRADLMVIPGWAPAPYAALLLARPADVRLVMVDGRVLFGDQQLVAAGPALPGCEAFGVCGGPKFLCLAESSSQDLLDQTFVQVDQILDAALSSYDAMVGGGGVAPFTPLADVTPCPAGSGCVAAAASIVSVQPGTSVPAGTPITFTGSGAGQGSLTLEWDFDWNGTPGGFAADASGGVAQVTPPAGSYLVGLRVTDSCTSPAPQAAFASVTITVGTSCTAASASIDAVLPGTSVPSGTLMTFDGSGTGQGALLLEWDFDWDGVPGSFTVEATGASVQHSPPDGSFTVGLRVTDSCASPQVAHDMVAISVGSCGPRVVVSQVYGGGGNAGAHWRQDYVELVNRGDAAQDLTGFTIQYAAATGSTWSATPLSGSIPPGGYYLIRLAQGAGGTADVPTPDAVGTIAMAAGSGKVALVDSTTLLSGTCPGSPSIRDLVGYGSGSCNEGSGPAPTLSNTTMAKRDSEGCTDSDDNAADFSEVTADASNPPRNSASTPASCSCS